MLPSSGYTRLNTVKNFVKISSRAWWHTRARATWNSALRRASKPKKKEGRGGDSRETKVLVKASRAYSPIFEYQPHLLLLTVFLVGQACPQYRNLYVLLCMIWLVEVGRYRGRSFLPLTISLRCSRKRSANLRPVSPMYTIDGHLVPDKQ